MFKSSKAVPWLRRSVAGLLTRNSGLDLRSVHVGFVVYEVALDRSSSQYFSFSLPVSFHQCSTPPCQYHSTNAPLSPASIIPPMLHSPLPVSFHQCSTPPCQYHSTNAPYPSSSTSCCYQKDKRAKPVDLQNQFGFGSRGAGDRKAL